ncbi:MAG: NAD-dependent deacylase [Bacteroidales bacterium]|nr:NAD-dependent deacylase [Bacteroidales bacterium]
MSDDLTEALDRAAEQLRDARSVCVLTGAGVSAESGVPTFRASDGLWEGHRIEDVASPQGWNRNPQLVWDFYHLRRANVTQVQPNPGHHALARMEQHWGSDRWTLVTQNVDGLHQVAGSRHVLELHGSLRRTRCLDCGEIVDQGLKPMTGIPNCPDCQGILRPDIVWFGEMLPPDTWRAAERAARECTVMLVVGTSAVVYPAAGLIAIAVGEGRKHPPGIVLECNLTETDASTLADIHLFGPSGDTPLFERLGI